MDWQKVNELEKDWWGNCSNTYGEETKQLLYANRMGLRTNHNGKSPYNFNLEGKSVLDIGGGPCSLLLKCENLGMGFVVDPCDFPTWVEDRYINAGLGYSKQKGELLDIKAPVDEVWIYNVLQHVEDPELVIANAKKAGKIIRIFEWIEIADDHAHPHALKEADLNKWLGGEGKTEFLSGENQCYGQCYYGVFPT